MPAKSAKSPTLKKREKPYISRTDYRIRIVTVFAFIVAYSITMILATKSNDTISATNNMLLRDPSAHNYHLLGTAYENENDLVSAQKQYVIANQKDKTLGGEDILRVEAKKNAQADISQSLLLWQPFVQKYPDYRDGWLVIAAYSYQLGQSEAAKQAIDQALRLDHKYPPTKQLEAIIKQ